MARRAKRYPKRTVPHRQKAYGGAKDFRGGHRQDPAYTPTEQFESPFGQLTHVRSKGDGYYGGGRRY